MHSDKETSLIKSEFINTFGVPDIDLEILHCIHQVRKGIECICTKDMEAYDLSIAQIDILAAVLLKGSASATILSERLNVSKPNLTGMIGRLEKRGLVKRRESKADRRVKNIELTKKGTDLINKVVPKVIIMMSEVLKSVSMNEKEALVSNLTLILDSLTNKICTKDETL